MLDNLNINLLIKIAENTKPKGLTRCLSCKHPELYSKIKSIQTDMCLKNFSECVFRIINNITDNLICPACNKTTLKFKGLNEGYQQECGKCSIAENLKKAMLEKYGVENASQIKGIQEKKKQTCLKKYGVEHHFQIDTIIEKRKITCRERYGVDAPLQSQQCKDKVKQTCLKKYGVDHHTKTKEVQDKKKETCINRYGVSNVMQSDVIKDKVRTTYYTNSNFYEYGLKLVKSKGYELIGDYSSAHSDITIKCDICDHIFTIMWNSFQQHSAVCPQCFPKHHGFSKQEKDIVDYIKTFIDPSNIIENTKKIITPYELDIVIPSKYIAIEYCGLYFHSSGPNSHDNKDDNYHYNKMRMCEDKDYRLITIFEDEWILKQNIVKSKIKQILGSFDGDRIYARQCKVGQISFKHKQEFLNQYHLQGDSVSSINLALFYNDCIVSVMTFLKANNKWELSRYCCKENVQVVGGASKLLSHFKNNNEWNHIFTYADKRWSDGSFYKTLGFSSSKETAPNYWYWGKGILGRKHRLNYSKKNLKHMNSYDQNLTEFQIMALEKYTWIYDCGNYKFKMTN